MRMLKLAIKRLFSAVLRPLGYKLVKDLPLIYVHKYSSYEEYAASQIYYNEKKLDQVWSDDNTLKVVSERVLRNSEGQDALSGVCHGSRNGYEVQKLRETLRGQFNEKPVTVIGTDISSTANNFDGMIQWDFHDINPDFTNKLDFVYSNSLDQSWKPFLALEVWLGQINDRGLVIIEHTRSHGPEAASEMDPFGVQPEYMPYVLAEYFGHRISVEILKTEKLNNKLECWLFILKKNWEFQVE